MALVQFFLLLSYLFAEKGASLRKRQGPSNDINGKKLIVYFPNWVGYGRNFQVTDLPIKNVTDVYYAFFDLKPNESGFYVPTSIDQYADFQRIYPTSGTGPNGTIVNGNFGQFLALKQRGTNFRFVVSIGGWTLSARFSEAVSTPMARRAFVDALINLARAYPSLIDGFDFDWEYISPPGQNYGAAGNTVGPNDAENFGLFLDELRDTLDVNGLGRITLHAAISSNPERIAALPLSIMNQTLDTINLMTYDMGSSAWGPTLAGHHSPVYSTEYSPLSVDSAVKYLIGNGIPPSKIVIGSPAYSRQFANTGGLGQPSVGVVAQPGCSTEPGVCLYRDLVRIGATEYFDTRANASYSYDPATRILNSFDNPQAAEAKCQYVHNQGLAGIMGNFLAALD